MERRSEDELVRNGAIPPDDFRDALPRIAEIAGYQLESPRELSRRLEDIARDLIVPRETLQATVSAIRAGHVVLQGPPGTGKSTLARRLAEAFDAKVVAVTAHEDWSTYDIVGRLELRLNEQGAQHVVPVHGAFTRAVLDCANHVVRRFDDPSEAQAVWLLIDELNRAPIDRAFGELFSVLGTDEIVSVRLPHQPEGNNVLVVPKRFRLIATLNSYDRQFVHSLSQGLRRRFTFITVDSPEQRQSKEPWALDYSGQELARREFVLATEQAIARVLSKTYADASERGAGETKLRQWITNVGLSHLQALFNFVESVRYAGSDSGIPHVPIGTAAIIDTIELFIFRAGLENLAEAEASPWIDWATSVKIVPLFEVDVVAPEQLMAFARGLVAPLASYTKRELLLQAAAGLHYVPYE